jgi:hypothetical protein
MLLSYSMLATVVLVLEERVYSGHLNQGDIGVARWPLILSVTTLAAER